MSVPLHFLQLKGHSLPPDYFNPPCSPKGESVLDVEAFVISMPGATVKQSDRLRYHRDRKGGPWQCLERIWFNP